MPIIPALTMLRQENHNFETSLGTHNDTLSKIKEKKKRKDKEREKKMENQFHLLPCQMGMSEKKYNDRQMEGFLRLPLRVFYLATST